MNSSEQESGDDSIWMSPEESQALLNEYQEFLDNYEQQLRSQLGPKKGEKSLQRLCDDFYKENNAWSEKLLLCDPETFEVFMSSREAKEKEESWKTLSPEVKEAIIEIERSTERIKRHSEEEAWKEDLKENSHRQIELLEKLEKYFTLNYWDQPLSRKEFYSFHLNREISWVTGFIFISFVAACFFGWDVASAIFTGNHITLERDIGITAVCIFSLIHFYQVFNRLRSEQKKMSKRLIVFP
ncbi:hypothetical protein [Nitrospira sp. Ecomares 2.1]